MIICKLKQLLEIKEKTVYWLSKETGISQHNLAKLVRNEVTSIKFDTLEKIMKALDCSLADIIEDAKE